MKDRIMTNIYVSETSQTIRFYYSEDQVTQMLRARAEDLRDAPSPDELAGIVDGNRVNLKYTLLIDKRGIENYDSKSALSAIKQEIDRQQNRRKRTKNAVSKQLYDFQ